jgi:hypothetical protein
MVKYNTIKELDDKKFRLYTGVKKDTFILMLKYLKEFQSKKKQSGQWQDGILTVEDKLLMTLQYYRENRSIDKFLKSLISIGSCKFLLLN